MRLWDQYRGADILMLRLVGSPEIAIVAALVFHLVFAGCICRDLGDDGAKCGVYERLGVAVTPSQFVFAVHDNNDVWNLKVAVAGALLFERLANLYTWFDFPDVTHCAANRAF